MKIKANEKGYLTVYLSLIMAVLLSFFLALTEGARYSVLEFETECIADIGTNSIMAEYNRQLLGKYNLFAIDSSYLTAYASKANTEMHLKKYIERNVKNEDIFLSSFLYRDFLGLNVESVQIKKVQLLTDEGVFKRKAVAAVRGDTGLTLLAELKEWLTDIEEDHLLDGNLEEEKEKVDAEIEEKIEEERARRKKEAEAKREEKKRDDKNGKIKQEPAAEVYEYNEPDLDYESPTSFLDEKRKEGILKYVLNTEELSKKKIEEQALIGERMRQGKISKGNMELTKQNGLQEIEERFLFQEYLLRYMGFWGKEKKDRSLDYQVEYLIAGKKTDIENLRAVANRICLIREAANVIYLKSDETKCFEAEILATGISILTGLPEIKDLLEESLILGWAYAESVHDVKVLMSGGKVPLRKTKDTWHYSLANALTMDDTGENVENGLAYEDYLRIFLMLSGMENLEKRSMNMVEADIRMTPGNEYFRMDGCYSAIEAEICFKSEFGYSFEMIKQKSYEGNE